MVIPHHDPRLAWHGAVSFERTTVYTRPWRIPFDQRLLFFPKLADVAASQAGIRLAFSSTTKRVAGRLLPFQENQKLDLFVDGQYRETCDLAGQSGFEFQGLEGEEKRIELWLPQRGDFALEHIEVDDSATFAPWEDLRPKWITYGSSITHCGGAASPSQTWPAIVARERELNLTCLGFGGECHLDVQIARLMRDLPADYLSVCAGINIFGGPSLNARSFGQALIGFVQILREKHPKTPLLLISPIYSMPREETPNSQGWTLSHFRVAVEETVRLLLHTGDKNVHYLNGLSLFDASLEDLMPDQLHPNAEGYEMMAKKFLLHAAPVLFDSRQP